MPLPIILCLHGRGTNALILSFQSRRITKALSPTFRFIFVDSPFETDPGVGVLPIFESCEPFRGWSRREGDIGDKEREREEVWRVLDAAVKEAGGWEDVVGVLGFSEGAQLAMGLAMGQILRVREGAEVKGHGVNDTEASRSTELRLKFAVLIGSPNAKIFVDGGVEDLVSSTRSSSRSEKEYGYEEVLKGFPTVFAWGKDDPWKVGWPGVEDMKRKSDFWSTMEFEGEHHLPLTDGETAKLCELIKLAWEAGRQQAVGEV